MGLPSFLLGSTTQKLAILNQILELLLCWNNQKLTIYLDIHCDTSLLLSFSLSPLEWCLPLPLIWPWIGMRWGWGPPLDAMAQLLIFVAIAVVRLWSVLHARSHSVNVMVMLASPTPSSSILRPAAFMPTALGLVGVLPARPYLLL